MFVCACVGGCARVCACVCVSASVFVPACESEYEVAYLRVRSVCVSTRGYSVVQVGRLCIEQ